MNYVLDSCAVLAYLQDETGADKVENLFGRSNMDIHIHAVNLMEVHYRFTAFGGDLAADEALSDLASLGIIFHNELPQSLFVRASFFKTRYPFLSLADSICIALGEHLKATVVTSDRPFATVKDGIKVAFIR